MLINMKNVSNEISEKSEFLFCKYLFCYKTKACIKIKDMKD